MGALLLGEKEFIEAGRRVQAMLGGVMRQVGFMAAGALYGFEHNFERLAEDHANARLIADAIAATPGVELEPSHVETNIIYFRVEAGAERANRLIADLDERDVKAWALGDLVRLVTSLNVDRAGCEYAAQQINALLD